MRRLLANLRLSFSAHWILLVGLESFKLRLLLEFDSTVGSTASPGTLFSDIGIGRLQDR